MLNALPRLEGVPLIMNGLILLATCVISRSQLPPLSACTTVSMYHSNYRFKLSRGTRETYVQGSFTYVKGLVASI